MKWPCQVYTQSVPESCIGFMLENYLVAILDSSPSQGFTAILVADQFYPECDLINVLVKMVRCVGCYLRIME